MASAQVLPSSRKQEHLEAGKRRLEEFRKKKAVERAKKAASTNQAQTSEVSIDDKQPVETEQVRITDSDGAGTSDVPVRTVDNFAVPVNDGIKTIDIVDKVEQGSVEDASTKPSPMNDYIASFDDVGQIHINNHDFKKHNSSGYGGAKSFNYSQETDKLNDDSRMYTGNQVGLPYGKSPNHSISQHPQSSQVFDSSSSQFSFYGSESFQRKESDSLLKDSGILNPGTHSLGSPPNSASSQLQTKASNASKLATGVDSVQPDAHLRVSSLEVKKNMNGGEFMNSDFGKRGFSSLAGSFPSMHGASTQTTESTGYNSDFRSSLNPVPQYSATPESNSRKSRPSFLDSLNVNRAPLGTSQYIDSEKGSFMSNTSKNSMDVLGSSAFQKPLTEIEITKPYSDLKPSSVPGAFEHSMNNSISSDNVVGPPMSNVNVNSMERKHEFYSPKQNEDFAALEQHIEDLTQEKFSLQRALEASRALAESLAGENSLLTENYNQQRSVVNQLKSDMENLQNEIKAHLVELESVKIEYANAQLECNAADERAKLLASEVIGLEDKALRLRSSELKLERQLEESHAEITLWRKKMSSLEKDRQDLQSTIDALQEEKKLLQSKLRKASASGKSNDLSRIPINKKDMSTSTEDLDAIVDTSNRETHDTASLLGNDTPDFPILNENGQSILESSSAYIPPDQMRMIQNINALVSELALEKEELIQALASESSQCSKLKDLNKELLRKLEVQTQRLELLTAKSMANENVPARLPNSHNIQENTTYPENITYADEGDEVVERVLGWIMKLFPGGPSRRTSKLL